MNKTVLRIALALVAAAFVLAACARATPKPDPEPPSDVAPSFGDAEVADQTYTVGAGIEPLELPAATGGDGELVYSLSPAVPGLSFAAATRTLSGTPSEAGTHAMTYTATDADDNTDAADAATLTFTITVEQPAPMGLPPESIQGYIVSRGLERVDIIGDGGATFDPALRINEFHYLDADTILVRYTETGEDGFSGWNPWNPLRWEYTVTSPTVAQIQVFMEDRDDGSPDSTLTLTFADEMSGSWEDLLRPNDRYPEGIRYSGTFTIRAAADEPVLPPPANRPPVVRIQLEDRVLTEPGGEGAIGVRFGLSFYFRDPDGDPLTFSASSSDETVATAVVNAENELQVASVAPGTTTVTVTATDPSGASASQTFMVTVEASPNRPPHVIAQIGPTTLRLGDTIAVTYSLTEYFDDINGDLLTFEASSSDETVATAVVNAAEDELRVASVAPGTATITVTATDPSGASASQTFMVTVEASTIPTNRPPLVLDEFEPLSLQLGVVPAVTYRLNAYFIDIDGDPLTFEASSSDTAVASAVVERSKLTVAAVGPGTATIMVSVTDPSGASAEQEFEVTVMAAETPDMTPISNTYRGHGDEVFHLNADGAPLDATYTLDLGSASAEVYLIATNTNAYRARSTFARLDQAVPYISGTVDESRSLHRSGPAAWRPEISEFNNSPPLALAHGAASYSRPSRSQAGDQHNFLDIDRAGNLVTIPATARSVVGDGTRTLTVWVADDAWGTGCALSACVQQPMTDAIAERFLRSGAGNDIHDWIVAVFGDPWGPHRFDDLISPEAASDLHILFFDIDGDDEDGNKVGFFWGKDLIIRNPEADGPWRASNERLMFYMDAYWLAAPDGDTWEVTDYGPSSSIGILAHEFQHMIHFYQKPVKHDIFSETWLNEMASEVAEDLIADKLSVYGPRGVLDDPTAGEPENWRGRLPDYNAANDIQVTAWRTEDSILKHYGIVYAFGAYLARTYGGAALFRDIVQSEHMQGSRRSRPL